MTTLLIALLALAAPHASAASPREELVTLTAQLQKAPSDDALRDKIIALAKKVKPAPPVPEEARRHFVMAGTFMKEAKTPEVFGKAAAEYQRALLAAPWWAEAYYNLALASESAARFADARAALKRYLALAPKGADARAAQDRLYALEAKESLAEAETAKETAKNDPSLITPGVGIGEIKLAMTEQEAVAILGAPTNRVPNGPGVIQAGWISGNDLTILAEFRNSGPAVFVQTSRSDRKTAEGIGPGSAVSAVRAAYGEPDKVGFVHEVMAVLCYRRGITFSYYKQRTEVSYVNVQEPARFAEGCEP